MEFLGHIIVLFLSMGGAGLSRQIFPTFSIVVIAGGVYFVGWWVILTWLVGLYFGVSGLAKQRRKNEGDD